MKCCARGRSTAGYFIREEIEDIIVKGYLVYRASQVGERLRGRPMLMRPETRAMMRRRVGRGWRGRHSEEDMVVVRVCCMGVWSSGVVGGWMLTVCVAQFLQQCVFHFFVHYWEEVA